MEPSRTQRNQEPVCSPCGAAHLAGAGTPQVDAGPQAHAEQVPRRPVYQVEVEVVLQLRSVQHFEGDLGDLAGRFAGRAEQLVAARDGTEGQFPARLERHFGFSSATVRYQLPLVAERREGVRRDFIIAIERHFLSVDCVLQRTNKQVGYTQPGVFLRD